jgi:hypothetical protein
MKLNFDVDEPKSLLYLLLGIMVLGFIVMSLV